MFKNAAKFDTLRTVAFGSITNTYTLMSPVLPDCAVVVAFKNNTDGIILVSFDGINDNLVYPGTSYGVYDIRSNAPNGTDYLLSQGTSIMIKYSGSAPTEGSFYAEVLLAQN